MTLAVAVVFGLLMGGGLGIALGAMLDDFPRGLLYGAAFGLVVGGAIYAFVLRSKRA